MWVPKIPQKWPEWKARMNAIEIDRPNNVPVLENSQVVLPRLTKLIPEPPKEIITDEALTIKKSSWVFSIVYHPN